MPLYGPFPATSILERSKWAGHSGFSSFPIPVPGRRSFLVVFEERGTSCSLGFFLFPSSAFGNFAVVVLRSAADLPP